MIGPPLAFPVERLRGDDLLESWAAVRFHQYRQLIGVRVRAFGAWRDNRRVHLVLAEACKGDVRRESGFGSGAGDSGFCWSFSLGGTVGRREIERSLGRHRCAPLSPLRGQLPSERGAKDVEHLSIGMGHVATGNDHAVLGARGGPLARHSGHGCDIAAVIDAHHVEASSIMPTNHGRDGLVGCASTVGGAVVIAGLGPCGRHLGGDLRRALHYSQHVGISHIEHSAHIPAGGRERPAIHGQTVGIGVHVVQRAHQTAICRVGGRALNQIDPLLIRMLLKYAGGAERRGGRCK